MRESSNDSSFPFLRKRSRYSFKSDAPQTGVRNVQLKRASWITFPSVLKISTEDPLSKADSMSSSKNFSSEVNPSRSSSLFRPSSSIRNLFSTFSSSSAASVTSSSSSASSGSASSTHSSPKVRNFWSNRFAHHSTDPSGSQEDYLQPDWTHSPPRSVCAFQHPPGSNIVSSLREEDEDDEGLMNTPRIISVRQNSMEFSRGYQNQFSQEGKGPTNELSLQQDQLSFYSNLANLQNLRGYKPRVVDENNKNCKNESSQAKDVAKIKESNNNTKNICQRNNILSTRMPLSLDVVDKNNINCIKIRTINKIPFIKEDISDECSNNSSESSEGVVNSAILELLEISNGTPFIDDDLDSSRETTAESLMGFEEMFEDKLETRWTNNNSMESSTTIGDSSFNSSPGKGELILASRDSSSNRIGEEHEDHLRTWNCNSNKQNEPNERVVGDGGNEVGGDGGNEVGGHGVNEVETNVALNDDSNLDKCDKLDPLQSKDSCDSRRQSQMDATAAPPSTPSDCSDPASCHGSLSQGYLQQSEELVTLRKKPSLNLKITQVNENDRIHERLYEVEQSAKSPRSAAIDIDILFKERQQQLVKDPEDNLKKVKDLTQRLKLPIGVPLVHSPTKWTSHGIVVVVDTPLDFPISTPPSDALNLAKALEWIKRELIHMKEQDQRLASQLVGLQLEIQRLRLVRSCSQHEELLDEVTCEEEEQRAYMTSADLFENPNNHYRESMSSLLRNIGVTRMNITRRRFSLS